MNITSLYCRIIERELECTDSQLNDLYVGTMLRRVNIHEISQVEISQFTTFLGNALSVSKDPGFGLRIGLNTRLAGFGEVGIAALSAPTVLEGLQVLETYSHLHSALSKLFLSVRSSGLELSVQHHRVDEFSPIYSEVFALLVQNYLEEVLGRVFSEGRYEFSHERPSYYERYTQVMHCPFEFGCQQTVLKIPVHLLRQRSPYYDADLWRQSLQQCADRLALLRESEAATYTTHVLSLLRSHYAPLPCLTDVARRLCLSDRSLSRRLKEEGTSFRKLTNDILNSRASDLLSNTQLTVDAIAAQLGYLEPANFRRSFKTWQGCSPAEYRANS